jgi:hypothetical protein
MLPPTKQKPIKKTALRRVIRTALDGNKRAVGGEEEDRTPDLRIANAALSQLSYPPNNFGL